MESVAIQVLLHRDRVGNIGRIAQKFPVKGLQEHYRSTVCCVEFDGHVEVSRFSTDFQVSSFNSLTQSSRSVAVSVCSNCASRLEFNMDDSSCILESKCRNLPGKLAPSKYFGSRRNWVFSLHFAGGAERCRRSHRLLLWILELVSFNVLRM